MILQKLEVEIERWGENKGKYKGVVKFSDERGEVSLLLSPEHIEQMFRVCAGAIIETSKRCAEDMTCKVIEQIRELS